MTTTNNTITQNGTTFDVDAAFNLADRDLLDRVASELDTDDMQALFDAYVDAHAKAFDGEEFVVA